MSAKDRVHTPWAFTLSGDERLPVLGERHPLRREAARRILWANLIALTLGVLLFTGWRLATQRRDDAPVARRVTIVRYTDLGVPPSIARPSRPQINVAQEIAIPPSIGVPEPVPEVEAEAPTIATQTEMAEELEPVTMEDLGAGTGDSLVVEGDAPGSPSPDEFIAVDEEPVRLRIDPPVYPEMARKAEVEGTVLVRVLVGTDGRVKDVILIDGPQMLREAALASARSAVFKPAMVQNNPVEVWVMMPVTFQLH